MGAYKFAWKKHGCFSTDNGFRSRGTARTHVTHLSDPDKTHYQEVKIQIDRLAGYGDSSMTWRKVDSKVYDWSRFTGSDVPTYSTSSMRAGLQPDTADLTVKVTVWLKQVRVGPDKTVWKYTRRSPILTCFGLNPAPALPSAGGG